MKFYKLSCPIFLLLMIFLASNCSGGGITFKDAFDESLGCDNTGDYDPAMDKEIREAHAIKTKKYTQRINDYISKANARLVAEQKEEANKALNLMQLIAIDPAYKTGLPDEMRVVVLYIDRSLIKSQLSVRDLTNRTAFDMALNVGNYKLIQDFLALGLPLINNEDINLLELLVHYLSKTCRNEISQEDQNDFVALFKDCLERILKDQDTLDAMDHSHRVILPDETAWDSIVKNIFSRVYFTPHQSYYKNMFDQLTNSLIIKKSPDLILNYKIELPEQKSDLNNKQKKIKESREVYLKKYVENRKERAEQVKKTQERKQKKLEAYRGNQDDDCCLAFFKLMIGSVW